MLIEYEVPNRNLEDRLEKERATAGTALIELKRM